MITTSNLTDEYNGLSTDTKPTENVRNGSVFIEIDSGKIYFFDQENVEWHEYVPASADSNEEPNIAIEE